MSYPNPDDYVRAVQNPSVAFAEPDLQQAQFVVSPMLGVPIPASGSTAVVFHAKVDGADQALRFFLREDASSRERYTALAQHVAGTDLSGNMASARWSDKGIRIGGRWYPLVRMQWVEGRPLDRYVEQLVADADTHSLATLADTWRNLVRRMQHARFAHGDLQHGNVLVDDGGTLRLVDFDCSWVTSFAGQPPPTESGHRNYQRSDASWGRWMDTFPALVIYLSLFALSRNPRPWEVLHQDESLLFQHSDFVDLDAAVWKQLKALRDPQVDAMVMRLKDCCRKDWQPTDGLEAVLGEQTISRWEWVNSLPPEASRPIPPPRPASPLPPPPPKPAPPKPAPSRPASARPSGPTRPGVAPGGRTPGKQPWWTSAPPPASTRSSPPVKRGDAMGVAVAVSLVLGLLLGGIVGGLSAAGGNGAAAFWLTFLFVAVVAFPIVLSRRS